MKIKENFDKIIEGTEVDIGVPMTPGRWKKGSQESKDGMLITVTCGGGLGGSKWNEVIIDGQIPAWPDEKGGLCTLTRINGQRFLLNPKYIVNGEFVSIVSAVFVNENSNYPLGEWKYSWLVRRDANVNFRPEFIYKAGG